MKTNKEFVKRIIATVQLKTLIRLLKVQASAKLTDKEMAIQIHKHLHTLKEPYKEVFVLRIFAELSFAEIGTIFSKSEVWARVTFYRGKNMLIKEMEV